MKEEVESVNVNLMSMKDDMINYEDRAMKLRDTCMVKINSNQEHLLNRLTNFISRVNNLEGHQSTAHQLLSLNKDSIEKINAHIQGLMRQHKEIDSKIFDMSMSKVEIDDFEEQKRQFREDVNFSMIGYESMKTKLDQTERYMYLYKPLQELDKVISALSH